MLVYAPRRSKETASAQFVLAGIFMKESTYKVVISGDQSLRHDSANFDHESEARTYARAAAGRTQRLRAEDRNLVVGLLPAGNIAGNTGTKVSHGEWKPRPPGSASASSTRMAEVRRRTIRRPCGGAALRSNKDSRAAMETSHHSKPWPCPTAENNRPNCLIIKTFTRNKVKAYLDQQSANNPVSGTLLLAFSERLPEKGS
jgi:hypothetical protein